MIRAFVIGSVAGLATGCLAGWMANLIGDTAAVPVGYLIGLLTGVAASAFARMAE